MFSYGESKGGLTFDGPGFPLAFNLVEISEVVKEDEEEREDPEAVA